MSGVVSRLAPSVFHLLRARRRCAETRADEKLALLRRLERQKVIRDLPETRVEQSFNEQLFAQVLGYRTLLSHDGDGFHLLPKNQVGPRRYDDFSLGHFGREGARVLATAEFKSPGTDLHKTQSGGGYGGRSPVEQALSAASSLPSCRWVLVSNFRDLLLYDVRSPSAPLAIVDLHEVRTADDLAGLCAHFDKHALIGATPMELGELEVGARDESPWSPVAAREGAYRVVFRFTPTGPEVIMPLAQIEQRLRSAILSFFDPRLVREAETRGESLARMEMLGGWVWADFSTPPGLAERIAVSRFGQVHISASITSPTPSGQAQSTFELYPMKQVAGHFLETCRRVFDTAALTRALAPTSRAGEVGLDLLDVDGRSLLQRVEGRPTSAVVGSTSEKHVFAGDFPAALPGGIVDGIARCICDIAVQFRGSYGGVMVDVDGLADELLKG